MPDAAGDWSVAVHGQRCIGIDQAAVVAFVVRAGTRELVTSAKFAAGGSIGSFEVDEGGAVRELAADLAILHRSPGLSVALSFLRRRRR